MKHLSLLFAFLLISLNNAFAETETELFPVTAETELPKIEQTADGSRRISGIVRDENAIPIIGATVALANNPTVGTITDVDGRFALEVKGDSLMLQVSYIGYETIDVPVKPNIRHYPITMAVIKAELDEVVVIGYGTQRKVDLTGSVSSISAGAFADRPITNATNALAGLASGLTVTNSGGNTPGYEAQSILVRGQGTLNNAAPLVVVDGMTGVAISDINPQDIENISVLKDAASSAIYGSRAANGVILITTRHGAESAPRLTYSGNVSFEKVAKRLNLVTDYADFMEIQNAGLIANGQAARFSQGKIDEWRNDAGRNPTIYPNTDWQDHIYRNPSVVQNHNLSVTGGGRRVRYNMSFGYVDNPGMIYYTDYNRYQLRTNLDVNIKPWLSVGTNLFGYIDSNNPSSENAAAGGDVIFGSGAFNTVPGMTLYDPATGLYGGIQNPEEENVSNFNPYRRQWFYKDDFPTKTRRMVAKLYASVKPFKGLTLRGSFTYNYWTRRVEQHLTDRDLYRFTADGPVLIREGVVRTYIRRYNYANTYRSSEITANYVFKASKLSGSVLIGASQEYDKDEHESFLRYDLIDDSLTSIDAATTNGPIGGNYTEWAMRSYFGRVNLSWDDKYLLEANFRADGSSKFAPKHRWGYFPSVSAGWRVSEEGFMKNTRHWLDQLKLRASYGSLGNNATTSYYMYQSLFATANYVLNGNIAGGFAQTILSDSRLTWEKTYMTNIGIDYALLNSRLSGSIDIYNKDTKGILISLPAPLEHGTSTVPNQNAGEVNNKGLELDIHWNDRIGKVSYNVGFNMSYVKNKVVKFQGDVSSISGVYKIQEGRPINQLYVMKVDRIVRDETDLAYVDNLVKSNPDYFATYQRPELGDFLYADTNGDGNLDSNDRVEIGNGTAPTFTYGINLGLNWNNFDFSVFFQGVGDYQVYYNNQAFRFVTVMGQSLNKDITDNAWTPENPYNSKYPILRNSSNGKNNIASDAFVHNAAYFRCKNIQLGYTIPQNITRKFFVENLKVYTSIDNLFTITSFPGLDPEVAANVGYPTVRQYSVGLNVTF
ncbi:TonB-dependent receptor [uncultured Duncaniella sp.]|uniref:SusC/RagA family TonB-linked outer membrane protein n=1 Tax=uncultured Duncaniella sp. TaxID=2768039 RepID=UPI00260D3C80|nr:TonB-dependent receptor [uncultured Duncaniella sp.]